MDIKELRYKIDELDSKLIELFVERLHVVKEVAHYKQAHNLPIYAKDRENDVLEKNLARVTEDELKLYVQKFLQSNMDISKEYQKNTMNHLIFLVGMPGAGKTTVGKALAKKLGIKFHDLDFLVQERAGKRLHNIIIYDGEEAFRQLEYDVIKDLLHEGPAVIATGGGTVLSKNTTDLMEDAGIVVFIHRDVKLILDDLDLEIRPLLKENIEYIFRLYEERCPLYKEVSDLQVQNASSIEDAVEQIVQALPQDCLSFE